MPGDRPNLEIESNFTVLRPAKSGAAPCLDITSPSQLKPKLLSLFALLLRSGIPVRLFLPHAGSSPL